MCYYWGLSLIVRSGPAMVRPVRSRANFFPRALTTSPAPFPLPSRASGPRAAPQRWRLLVRTAKSLLVLTAIITVLAPTPRRTASAAASRCWRVCSAPSVSCTIAFPTRRATTSTPATVPTPTDTGPAGGSVCRSCPSWCRVSAATCHWCHATSAAWPARCAARDTNRRDRRAER